MSLWGNEDFAVVMFTASHIRGAVFRYTKSGTVLGGYASEEIVSGDASGAWRKVLQTINCSKTLPLFITGSFKGGIFFQTESLDLPVNEQRGAVELELPRHLISIPEKYKLQIMSYSREDDKALVNAYIFPPNALGGVAESLSGCGRQTDGFIYPLMALNDGDPLFYHSGIEPGFCFSAGQWRPYSGDGKETAALWKTVFEEHFALPEDLDVAAWLPVLLTARLVSGKDYAAKRGGLYVLPDNMRPKRIRRQLQLTCILAVSVVVLLILNSSGTWNKNRREYSRLRDEIKRLSRETVAMQTLMRRQTRTNKERAKIVGIKAGEQDVLAFLAGFSSLLPENVSVSNLRFNESGVDIVLASETENLDLARVLKPLSDWKISQLQQRQNRGGNGNTVNLKLVPVTGETQKKGRRR